MMEVDPFFAVKREVEKTIDIVNGLHSQWLLARSSPSSRDEFMRLGDELRNNLKNIEWDLEDLEEAIRVSEKNPARFSLDGSEINNRKKFVSTTRSITEKVKQNMETPDVPRHSEPKSLKPLINKFVPGLAHKVSYTKLASDDPENLFEDTVNKQKMIIKSQDEQLSTIGTSVQALKNMSNQIGLELDEQSVMLDEFAHEMDTTDTKLDGVMKKMAKVLHMSNDRRQWIAIGVLLLILIVVIILFMIL